MYLLYMYRCTSLRNLGFLGKESYVYKNGTIDSESINEIVYLIAMR